MYRLTHGSEVVVRIEDGTSIPPGNWMWEDYEAWLAQGNTPSPPAPPFEPNTPAHHRAIRDAAWQWMSEVVTDRGYDSIETCVGYYNSGVARYRSEARAMVAWRDAVSQALEGLVMNPPKGVVTWDQVVGLLPQPEAFNWPTPIELPLSTIPAPDPAA